MQVSCARDFAKEYSKKFDHDEDTTGLMGAIDNFETEVVGQLGQLDQTVKDLLQFVSMSE